MNWLRFFRRARTPLEFALWHEREAREFQAYEQRAGKCTAWVSRLVEYLDERDQIEEFNHE